MKKSWKWMVLASVFALTAGCSNDTKADEGEALNAQHDTKDVTLNDAQIIRVLQVANDGEVMLGELGQARATSAPVRDFNTKMVTAHTEDRQRVDALARDQGIEPEDSVVAQQLQEEVERMMEVLEGLEGERFDLTMMDTQIAVHGRTAMVGDGLLAPQAKNAALQQQLPMLRAHVQEHLEEALLIQTDLFQMMP